jgi:hypothetical protein
MMAELEFRDGKRVVPDYMDQLMADLPLHKYTYEQAVDAMNRKLERNVIDTAVDRVIDQHLVEHRTR